MRCPTLPFAFELPVALPDCAAIFAVGMPDLGTIVTAAIPTDDAGGENAAAAVVEAQPFPPSKLSLHQIKLLQVDDRLMALFDVVLGNLALIDLPLFVQKIHGKALLRYDPITDTIQFFLRARVQGGSNL